MSLKRTSSEEQAASVKLLVVSLTNCKLIYSTVHFGTEVAGHQQDIEEVLEFSNCLWDLHGTLQAPSRTLSIIALQIKWGRRLACVDR